MSFLLSSCRITASISHLKPSKSTITTSPRTSYSSSKSRLSWKSMSQSTADSANPMTTTTTAPNNAANTEYNNTDDVLIQYVVLRRDLIDTWPMGSVVTQGCHASVAAIWSHKDDPHTLQYCSPEKMDSMHKVIWRKWELFGSGFKFMSMTYIFL